MPPSKPKNDGLVRISVTPDGKRTSISVDDLLFRALCRDQGDSEAAIRWVQKAAYSVDSLKRVKDPVVALDKAGLSRLVQRLITNHLLKIN